MAKAIEETEAILAKNWLLLLGAQKHKDLRFCLNRPNRRGISEILFRRILVFMWSFGRLKRPTLQDGIGTCFKDVMF